MKSLVLSLIILIGITCASCDGRTGYLDEGQLSTVAVLTDVEWLLSYYNPGFGKEYEYDEDTQVYRYRPHHRIQ